MLLCVFAALERTQTELFDLKTKYDEESTAKYVRVTSYVDHHSYSFINQFIINLAYDKLFHVQLASDYLSWSLTLYTSVQKYGISKIYSTLNTFI